MLKKILIGLGTVFAIFLVIVALQPADFRVERSTVISAPPSKVFSKVNNLRTWQEFSPWAKLDPNAKVTFSGP
ncbi:MAG: polyketide cyclase, partial [Rariglobus sp.]